MHKLRVGLFALFIFFTNSTSASSALIGKDLSASFTTLFAQNESELVQAIPELVDGIHVILIPGFFSKFTRRYFISEYFADYSFFFKKMKISHEILAVNSEDSPDGNREIIRKAIEKSGGRVLIIGHSYGGIYALSTLLHHPELQEKITGLITLQSPFHGTQIIRYLNHPFLRTVSEVIIRLFGGKQRALDSLSEPFRKAHLIKWQRQISALLEKIPTLTIASKITPTFWQQWLWPTSDAMDGLVDTQSQTLPFPRNHFVILEDWDHLDTVAFSWRRWRYSEPQKDRIRLLAASLISILRLRQTQAF